MTTSHDDAVHALLLFDVEDVFSPPELGNDDSIMELADILASHGLKGTFLFIGDRAKSLRDRGRDDVIASLQPHEVGLHTRSAQHPCGPEYVANRTWDEGFVEALQRERDGVAIVERIFGKPAAALSTHWLFTSPHAVAAAGAMGLPYLYALPAAPPHHNLCWYAGALCLPWLKSPDWFRETDQPITHPAYFGDIDDDYADDERFAAMLRRYDAHVDDCIARQQPVLAILMMHPQRLRLAQFIDGFMTPNGVNLPRDQWGSRGRPRQQPPQVVDRIRANFARFAAHIAADKRLNPSGVNEMVRRFGGQPDHISLDDLLAAAAQIVKHRAILLHDRFSPAELTLGMAQAFVHVQEQGRLPDRVTRMQTLGPKRNLIVRPEVAACDHKDLHRLASRLIASVQADGHLPAWLDDLPRRVGVNHLHLLLAEALVAVRDDCPRKNFELFRMPRYPEVAIELGRLFLSIAEGENLDPDLNVDALYRHAKLQTWSLKPASSHDR